MQPKILTINDFFKYFSFREEDTGCGIEAEPMTGENFLWAQTYLPKEYFNINLPNFIINPYMGHLIESIPDQVLIKFELFGIGHIENIDAFIFKPWVVNVEMPELFSLFENFHLFVPCTLFYNLIDRLIFSGQLNPNDFEYIRILQDIPPFTFQRFGLDRESVPRIFKSDQLEISRLTEIDKTEILKFYSDNSNRLTPELEIKYFRPLLNTWFKITIKEQADKWFGLRQSTFEKTIGYLRLYNTTSTFTGGTSLEYIIDKTYRNKGFATKATSALIVHMKKYSYATSLGAQVSDNNEFSKKLLKRLGFNTIEEKQFNGDNFALSILDYLEHLENRFNSGHNEFSIMDKYANKYKRYFQ